MSSNSISVLSRVWFNIKDFNCKTVSQESAASKSGISWLLWFLGDFSNIFLAHIQSLWLEVVTLQNHLLFPRKLMKLYLDWQLLLFGEVSVILLPLFSRFFCPYFYSYFLHLFFFKRSSYFRQLDFKRALGVTLLNMKCLTTTNYE